MEGNFKKFNKPTLFFFHLGLFPTD